MCKEVESRCLDTLRLQVLDLYLKLIELRLTEKVCALLTVPYELLGHTSHLTIRIT